MKPTNLFSLSTLLMTALLLPFTSPLANAQEAGGNSGSDPTDNQTVDPPPPDDPEEQKCGDSGSGSSRSMMSSSFASISAGLSALAPDMPKPSVVGLRASNVGAPVTKSARSAVVQPSFPGGISAYYATPESLTPFGKGGEILRSPQGWVRQIRTMTGFLNVEVIPDGYRITGYNPTELEAKKNAEGFYTVKPGAEPLSRRTVTALDGGSKIKVEETTWYGKTPRTETLLMEQKAGKKPGTAVLSQIWSNHNGEYRRASTTLSLEETPSKARSARTAPPVEHYVNEVEELGTDGKYYVVKRVMGTRTTYRWDKGAVPLAECDAVDATGNPLPESISSTWTYYTDPADRGSYGRPATLRRSNGEWENYEYSDNQMAGIKTTRTMSPWMNTPAPAPGQAPAGVYRLKQEVKLTTDTGTSGTTVTVNGVPIQKEWTDSVREGVNTIVETKHQPHSGGDKITVTKRYCRDKNLVNEALMGRPLLVKNANGSLETYSYEVDNTVLKTTRDVGYGSDNKVTKGLRIITKQDKASNKLMEEVHYALEGGQAYWLSSRTGVEFDPLGNCLKWVYDNNSEDYTEQRRDCCQINWERGRDGVETTYTRNADGKIVEETSRGITRTWERNGLTTIEWKKVAGSDQHYLVRETTMDMAGNIVSEKTPVVGGNTVTTNYTYNVPAREVRATTPMGTSKKEIFYADKQVASTTTTTGVTATCTYTADPSVGGGIKVTVQENGATRTIQTDLLGNEARVVAGNGATIESTYDQAGQLVKKVYPDGETQLYQYEADGIVINGLDLNGDGVLNLSEDRMTRSERTYDPSWPTDKGSWKVEEQAAWKGRWLTTGIRWNTQDGTSSKSWSLGVDGYYLNEMPPIAQRKGDYSMNYILPDGRSFATKCFMDGGILKRIENTVKNSDGYSYLGDVIVFDIWGKVISKAEGQKDEKQYVNDVFTGKILSIKSPDGKITSYQYDSYGRRDGITMPNGERQHFSYDLEGNVVRQWGAYQYPVAFEYDNYGRKTAMTTYRTPVGATASWPEGVSGDRTQWVYDAVSGNLLKKNDAAGVGTAYAYTLGGKVKTKTNARGQATEYIYDEAGQVASIETNDQGATPRQMYSYDQRGRLVSALTEGVLSCLYGYNDKEQLVSEQWTIPTANGDFTREIERRYDSYGRSSGYQLKQGEQVEQAVDYAYNPAAQLASIAADGKTFSYEYMADAPQILTRMDSPVHTVTNVWEVNRDMLSSKTNAWKNKENNPVISSYTYAANDMGQRTSVTTDGEAFAQSTADWTWNYDVLGQVKQANEDHYAYDQIGNRISSGRGDQVLTTYASNTLNQYTAINGGVPFYDADGNLLSGLAPTAALPGRGNLSFIYNADNRPVQIKSGDVVEETRTYDNQGRRIQKGNTITLYDGYNAIAEYDKNTHALKSTYAWGNDLSGTSQGAGGVGGLLSVTEHNLQIPVVSYPCYDANGNVTEYVSEENGGTLTAHYEYDAFGNVVRKTGEKEYSYQFSTKPYDRLTGLVYYNYRDYDPLMGRWLGRDKEEEEGGFNLYAIKFNDFVNNYDYLGNFISGLNLSFTQSVEVEGCMPAGSVPGLVVCINGSVSVTADQCCEGNQVKGLYDATGTLTVTASWGGSSPGVTLTYKASIKITNENPGPCPSSTDATWSGRVFIGFKAAFISGECSYNFPGGGECSSETHFFPVGFSVYGGGSVSVNKKTVE